MARGRQYLEADRARIEIIPMIDIMMFLLVFFMIVTLRMIAGSGITLELPGSSTADELSATKLTIGVEKSGAMHLEGKPITAEMLTTRLQSEKLNKKVEIVIAGDKNTALQSIIRVMDICRAAGITAIGIATKTETDG
ncbi:MAG: biopolymer transporter ExbD [Pseudomonadota bacterium]